MSKKKLFSNYNFEFNTNEKKLLTNFCKQALKQAESDEKFLGEARAFNSVLKKLHSGEEIIKLTKDEKTRLTNNLKQNIEYLEKQKKKSWFIKKWFINSLYNQYIQLYENHFKG